jgi:hypothetical protein
MNSRTHFLLTSILSWTQWAVGLPLSGSSLLIAEEALPGTTTPTGADIVSPTSNGLVHSDTHNAHYWHQSFPLEILSISASEGCSDHPESLPEETWSVPLTAVSRQSFDSKSTPVSLVSDFFFGGLRGGAVAKLFSWP